MRAFAALQRDTVIENTPMNGDRRGDQLPMRCRARRNRTRDRRSTNEKLFEVVAPSDRKRTSEYEYIRVVTFKRFILCS